MASDPNHRAGQGRHVASPQRSARRSTWSTSPSAVATNLVTGGTGRRRARHRGARRRDRPASRRGRSRGGLRGAAPVRIARLDVLGAHPRTAVDASARPDAQCAGRCRSGSLRRVTLCIAGDPVAREIGEPSRGAPRARRRRRPPRVPRRRLRQRRTTSWRCSAKSSASRRPSGCRSTPSSAWRAPRSTMSPLSARATALTGPAARGDWATIARHLDALDPVGARRLRRGRRARPRARRRRGVTGRRRDRRGGDPGTRRAALAVPEVVATLASGGRAPIRCAVRARSVGLTMTMGALHAGMPR